VEDRIVTGKCVPCGGGGGGGDGDGPEQECPHPHGEADLPPPHGNKWVFSDAIRPYPRTYPGGSEECFNLDLLSAMNQSIVDRCNAWLRRAVQFIEANLKDGQARNVLSDRGGTTLTWHDYGMCSGSYFENQFGNSLLFGRGCAKRRGDEFTFEFVWSLEDTAFFWPHHWLTGRKRWTFSWKKDQFAASCAFTPPPPPPTEWDCLLRLHWPANCGV
jgi:hypothetical protein